MKKQTAGWMAAVAAVVFAAAAVPARAATLATWSLKGTETGETEYSEALSVADVTAGPGITASIGSSGMSGTGWTSPTFDQKAYYEFGVTAAADHYLTLSELSVSLRSTKTGPGNAEVRCSTDGKTWTSLATLSIPLDSSANGYTIDFGSVSVGVGQTLTIRIYAWGGSGTSGTFRMGNGTAMTLGGTPVGTSMPPTIAFPREAESVAASNTLTVAFDVLPEGIVTGWSFLPEPVGAYSLSGTTFTFTPAGGDTGGGFTLSVTATNSHGETTAELPVAVTEYVPAGAWTTGFETGKNPGYTAGEQEIDGRTWSVQQIAFLDGENVPKVGSRACVFGSYSEAFMVSAEKLLGASRGIGTVSFLYAAYPEETEPCQPLVVEIATDKAAANWMELGRVNPTGAAELTPASFALDSGEPVYLRIRTEYVNGSGRVCLDQLTVTPYAEPVRTAFEKYLLDYNVTPGDPGCASETVWAEGEDANSYKTDDFDEDGYSNWAEFNANPRTNPYDKTSHP